MRKHYPVVREILIVFCTVAGVFLGWSAGEHAGFEQSGIIGAFAGMGLCGALADAFLGR
jgi:hypothetical protein